ncbi:Sphingosine N-acyltransferase lag1 [Cyberlindnera fabianii]|uniref:Sphingosine N-acyltransferase lag1 n=1 Tax=Cyberlindnera fabianii TaxID=36022 RepID=A0A1V2LCT2_CYBFA|nr:Sphingosine N-acyltransferase lag1 [Cyberlindnera fabianii]
MTTTSVKKNETIVFQRSTDTSSTSSDDDLSEVKTQYDDKEKHTKVKPQVSTPSEVNAIDKYQMEISIIILMSFALANCFEITAPYVDKFIHLQNKYPGTDFYDIDINDAFFVFTWIFVATFIRAFTMNYILRPLASCVNITSHKAIQRFMEQGWYLVYYSTSFIFGSYIYYHSPYFLNFDNFYIGWPHDKMTWLFKAYYLAELAGNVIMVIMDVVDIFLSTAKLLKYSGVQTFCDVMFGVFLISWVMLRHGLYNYMFYHAATSAKTLMVSGKCIEGLIQKTCWTDNIITIFLSLLGGLQIIMCIWMYLIAKVAIKVVTGTGAEDVRSDDED